MKNIVIFLLATFMLTMCSSGDTTKNKLMARLCSDNTMQLLQYAVVTNAVFQHYYNPLITEVDLYNYCFLPKETSLRPGGLIRLYNDDYPVYNYYYSTTNHIWYDSVIHTNQYNKNEIIIAFDKPNISINFRNIPTARAWSAWGEVSKYPIDITRFVNTQFHVSCVEDIDVCDIKITKPDGSDLDDNISIGVAPYKKEGGSIVYAWFNFYGDHKWVARNDNNEYYYIKRGERIFKKYENMNIWALRDRVTTQVGDYFRFKLKCE